MTCPLGADIDFVYGRKWNNHENEVEHRSIEKYLRTLMAKKLHGALLVPQKAPRRFACSAIILIIIDDKLYKFLKLENITRGY